ncbi:MAG: nicotinate (nicotinamide) nucleotide adenylyltransferase [Clostridiales bacterium]|jgi:nicotinate-nucleotide adenylyltransferase|nr:nicotinate (nicotinamide) nucleotide adenylyltransferase [Clostridiales bacterium]
MRKTGVYGGTFNPIHNGHIHLAKQFAQQLGLDRVLLIPAFVPPHKFAPDLAPAEHRLAMCRLASPGTLLEVSDMEIRRKGASYTCETLRELKKRNPEDELYLLMGEDMFLTVQDWCHPEVLYSLSVLCAAPRSGDGTARILEQVNRLERAGAKTAVCNIQYLPVSSTMVRGAVKKGESIAGMVPAAVAEYIRENQLYLGCGK